MSGEVNKIKLRNSEYSINTNTEISKSLLKSEKSKLIFDKFNIDNNDKLSSSEVTNFYEGLVEISQKDGNLTQEDWESIGSNPDIDADKGGIIAELMNDGVTLEDIENFAKEISENAEFPAEALEEANQTNTEQAQTTSADSEEVEEIVQTNSEQVRTNFEQPQTTSTISEEVEEMVQSADAPIQTNNNQELSSEYEYVNQNPDLNDPATWQGHDMVIPNGQSIVSLAKKVLYQMGNDSPTKEEVNTMLRKIVDANKDWPKSEQPIVRNQIFGKKYYLLAGKTIKLPVDLYRQSSDGTYYKEQDIYNKDDELAEYTYMLENGYKQLYSSNNDKGIGIEDSYYEKNNEIYQWDTETKTMIKVENLNDIITSKAERKRVKKGNGNNNGDWESTQDYKPVAGQPQLKYKEDNNGNKHYYTEVFENKFEEIKPYKYDKIDAWGKGGSHIEIDSSGAKHYIVLNPTGGAAAPYKEVSAAEYNAAQAYNGNRVISFTDSELTELSGFNEDFKVAHDKYDNYYVKDNNGNAVIFKPTKGEYINEFAGTGKAREEIKTDGGKIKEHIYFDKDGKEISAADYAKIKKDLQSARNFDINADYNKLENLLSKDPEKNTKGGLPCDILNNYNADELVDMMILWKNKESAKPADKALAKNLIEAYKNSTYNIITGGSDRKNKFLKLNDIVQKLEVKAKQTDAFDECKDEFKHLNFIIKYQATDEWKMNSQLIDEFATFEKILDKIITKMNS